MRISRLVIFFILLINSSFSWASCLHGDTGCLKSQAIEILENKHDIISGGLVADNKQPKTLSGGNWISGDDYYSNLLEIYESFEGAGEKLTLYNLDLSNFTCTSKNDSSVVCSIRAEETTQMLVNGSADEDSLSSEETNHQFTFISEDGSLVIDSHIPESIDNIKFLSRKPLDGKHDELIVIDSSRRKGRGILQKVPEDMPPPVKSLRGSALFSPVENHSRRQIRGRGYYNRANAQRYAVKWAKGRNPAYPKYANDCTNYVSQVLKAGGWRYKYDIYRLDTAWYPHAWPWAGAHNFFNHLKKGNRAKINSTNKCSWRVGDVVSADWNFDRHVDHTMVITKMRGCAPYLSYHSTDTLNKYGKTLPRANYWVWSITGTY